MDTRNLTQVGRMWYLTAMVNGARISKSLRTDDLDEARRKRDEILGERLASRDEVTLLKSVRRQLEGIQFEEMERASSRTSGELLMYAHRKWLHSANRRYCGEHQEHMHVSHWKDFLDWLRKAHPETVYCRQLTRGIAMEYSDHVFGSKRSTRTYNTHMTSCRQILSVIEQADEHFINPFGFIHHRSERDSVSKEAFTDGELRLIFSHGDDEFRLLFAVGLYTTLRLSSALKLKWEQVSGGYLAATHEKTGADASIRIPDALSHWIDRVPDDRRHGAMFPTFGNMGTHSASFEIQRRLQELGIVTQTTVVGESGLERTACVKGFHSLRHTAITLSLQNGATVASVRRLAGHATERMQAHYTHLGADTAGQASDAIGVFW